MHWRLAAATALRDVYAAEAVASDGLGARLLLAGLLQDDDEEVRECARRALPGSRDGGQSFRAALEWVLAEAAAAFYAHGELVDWLVRAVAAPSPCAVHDDEGGATLYAADEGNAHAERALVAELAARQLAQCRARRLASALDDDDVTAEIEYWLELAVKASSELARVLEDTAASTVDRFCAVLLCEAVGDALDAGLHLAVRRAQRAWSEPLLVRALRRLRTRLERAGGGGDGPALL